MNYEQFKTIPAPVFNNLNAILNLKAMYGMEFTSFERELVNHFNTFSQEIMVNQQKAFLEHCFSQ